ncbi:alpha/beta hydrolase [Massilia sp. TS11]|uniref:alpha/beta hydrolase n=1 Tax=Massilia sp. TS11 TaxID=2908003 RepID=UPI001EDC28E9|nr:alpha/beta hydrolase-fold protein [Massilia sp. TS11]MCG2586441.1 hypothetical protein [Massilia sp. TS11]
MSRQRRQLLLALLAAPLARAAGLPQVGVGRIERLADFPSRHVPARHIDVWLPPGHDGQRPLRVLYMHDGQMLFDARSTWNGQSWQVADTLARLIASSAVAPTMVVGIWNKDGLRTAEYFPQRALDYLPPALRDTAVRERLGGAPQADAYLRFLVEELKPAIDARYPTRAGRADTAIMGSSMGGLISLYALCEYPQVFGGAAGLSTHWTGLMTQNASVPLALFRYLQTHLPDPASHRLYLDTGDQTLDALYPPHQDWVDLLVREAGYGAANFRSCRFPGAAHLETAWAARLEEPLRFLLA